MTVARSQRAAQWRWALAVASAIGAARPASALDAQGEATVSAETGVDSNPSHDTVESEPAAVIVGRAQLAGALSPEGKKLRFTGDYDLGAKHFFGQSESDVVAQVAKLGASYRLLPSWILTVEGAGKDRTSRDGDRDHRDFEAHAGATTRLGPVTLAGDAGVEHFLYRPDRQYSFTGPRAQVGGAWAIARAHRLLGGVEGGLEYFDGIATDANGTELGPRHDGVLSTYLSYEFKGPVVASATYGFRLDQSNAYGQSSQRHRVSAQVAVFLPARIALLAQGALQWTRFPDGISLSPDLLLQEDSESTNQLTLKLTRAFDVGLELSLRGELYQSSLSTNGIKYAREQVLFGVGWHFDTR